MPIPVRHLQALVLTELRKDRAYLVPLRLFIGLGWLRAAVEKVVDPAWYDGVALSSFLTQQLAWSQEAFPLYGALMERVLLPAATPIGLLVIVLQFAAGVAIVVGYRTGPALLVGLGLNVNFVLAGVPDPSAFYIVIQLVLFAGGAGRVLGLDGLRISSADAAALTTASSSRRVGDRRRLYAGVAVASVAFAAAVAPSVSSLSPATVVEDPAMILVVSGLFAAAVAALGALSVAPLRSTGGGRPVLASTRPLTPSGAPLR